jgi:hypothetical protein
VCAVDSDEPAEQVCGVVISSGTMSQGANSGTDREAQPKVAEEAAERDAKQGELTEAQLENVAGGFLGGLIKKAGGSLGTTKPVAK